MKLLHLDLETSSLSPWKGAILEIGAIPVINGVPGEPFHANLQPHAGAEVHDKALQTNGLTRDELGSSSRLLPGAAFNAFLDLLSSLIDRYDPADKLFLVAYNAGFDVPYIEEFFKRNHNRYFGSYFWRPPICTYALSAFHLGDEWGKLPDRKLATVANRLAVPVPSEGTLHTALYDVWLSKGIYEHVEKKHKGAPA